MSSKPSPGDSFTSDLKALLRHPAFVVACAVLLLLPYFISSFAQQKLVTEPHNKTIEAAAKIIPSGVSQAVTIGLNERRQALREAAARPLLQTALSSDTADMVAVQKRIAALLPHASTINLIRKPQGFEDQSNFVAKALVDAALRGESPPITTMKRDGWFILMAEPVFGLEPVNVGSVIVEPVIAEPVINEHEPEKRESNKNTIGAIFIEVPLTALGSLFNAADPSLGRLELVQKITGVGRQTLVSAGAIGVGNETKTPVTSVPGWLVCFTPSQKLIDQHQPDLTLWRSLRVGLWAAALLGIVLAGKILSRRLKQKASSSSSSRATVKTEGETRFKSQYLLKREAETLVQTNADEELMEGNCAEQAKTEQTDAGNLSDNDPSNDLSNDLDNEVFDLSASEDDGLAELKQASEPNWPAHVFRDYDIRGLAGQEIDEDFASALGQTLGTQTLDKGENTIIVGRDGRLSSPALAEALVGGLLMTGCNVIDLGQVPTPAVNFASQVSTVTNNAVIVTASHNPGTFNGFKLVSSGTALHGTDIQTLRDDMLAKRWRSGEGTRAHESIGEAYIEAICQDIETLTPLSVVVDCGNGVAGTLAPQLMQKLGCECVPLYCDVNGAFPNHPPDPTQKDNLNDLIQVVKQAKADLGLAFDGDGDRLVAVTASGRIVWPDELMMIFARDIINRHPGTDIVFDVKSTRRLSSLISDYGGRPVMWKTGHAHIREKVAELQAPLGGEFSGHLFFNDRWHGFDDGLYAAARLLEVLSLREQSLDTLISTFEPTVSTAEIRLPVDDADKFPLMEKIIAAASFENANINTLDGMRVDFEESWGLIRASNTEAALTLRFEAGDSAQLKAVQGQFKSLLGSVNLELEQALDGALSSAA
ncbi:MAG: phosphomannomutase/phosphoglucomutase [Porticoccaceae bacterium]